VNRFQPGRQGLALALLFMAGGLVAIGIGYNGAAGHLDLRAQFPYLLSGGFVGLSLVIIGAAMLINQGAREDRSRMEGILQQLLDAQLTAGGGSTRVPADANGLFAAGTASFHRPGCRLVDGREEVSYVTAAEAASRDLKACRVCQPEATNVTVV
jgi:hypothetical protein